eukprot:PhF_6_TR41595/c0_g1_i2/m.63032/K00432/gpx; glutathione peroxidase
MSAPSNISTSSLLSSVIRVQLPGEANNPTYNHWVLLLSFAGGFVIFLITMIISVLLEKRFQAKHGVPSGSPNLVVPKHLLRRITKIETTGKAKDDADLSDEDDDEDPAASTSSSSTRSRTSFYDFSVKDIKNKEHPLNQYKGKVVMVMNVASYCTYTESGYKLAEELSEKYKDQGFVVLAFPCNQFGAQEPKENDDIDKFVCNVLKTNLVKMMGKTLVNGESAHPLWTWLQESAPGLFGSTRIQWNFTKFLISRRGVVKKRYGPRSPIEEIEPGIVKLLKASPPGGNAVSSQPISTTTATPPPYSPPSALKKTKSFMAPPAQDVQQQQQPNEYFGSTSSAASLRHVPSMTPVRDMEAVAKLAAAHVK